MSWTGKLVSLNSTRSIINNDIEAIKRKKLKLKDEIYRLLKSSEADPLT